MSAERELKTGVIFALRRILSEIRPFQNPPFSRPSGRRPSSPPPLGEVPDEDAVPVLLLVRVEGISLGGGEDGRRPEGLEKGGF